MPNDIQVNGNQQIQNAHGDMHQQTLKSDNNGILNQNYQYTGNTQVLQQQQQQQVHSAQIPNTQQQYYPSPTHNVQSTIPQQQMQMPIGQYPQQLHTSSTQFHQTEYNNQQLPQMLTQYLPQPNSQLLTNSQYLQQQNSVPCVQQEQQQFPLTAQPHTSYQQQLQPQGAVSVPLLQSQSLQQPITNIQQYPSHPVQSQLTMNVQPQNLYQLPTTAQSMPRLESTSYNTQPSNGLVQPSGATSQNSQGYSIGQMPPNEQTDSKYASQNVIPQQSLGHNGEQYSQISPQSIIQNIPQQAQQSSTHNIQHYRHILPQSVTQNIQMATQPASDNKQHTQMIPQTGTQNMQQNAQMSPQSTTHIMQQHTSVVPQSEVHTIQQHTQMVPQSITQIPSQQLFSTQPTQPITSLQNNTNAYITHPAGENMQNVKVIPNQTQMNQYVIASQPDNTVLNTNYSQMQVPPAVATQNIPQHTQMLVQQQAPSEQGTLQSAVTIPPPQNMSNYMTLQAGDTAQNIKTNPEQMQANQYYNRYYKSKKLFRSYTKMSLVFPMKQGRVLSTIMKLKRLPKSRAVPGKTFINKFHSIMMIEYLETGI